MCIKDVGYHGLPRGLEGTVLGYGVLYETGVCVCGGGHVIEPYLLGSWGTMGSPTDPIWT